MEIVEIEKTCESCPSQWEGSLKDGRMFYCRYRWGNLAIDLSLEPTDDIYVAMDNNIYYETHGDDLDGTMSYSELKVIMEGQGFKFNHLNTN